MAYSDSISQSTPHSFLPWTRMSLGHLIIAEDDALAALLALNLARTA